MLNVSRVQGGRERIIKRRHIREGKGTDHIRPHGYCKGFTPSAMGAMGDAEQRVTWTQKHSRGGAEKSSDSQCILKSQPKSWV